MCRHFFIVLCDDVRCMKSFWGWRCFVFFDISDCVSSPFLFFEFSIKGKPRHNPKASLVPVVDKKEALMLPLSSILQLLVRGCLTIDAYPPTTTRKTKQTEKNSLTSLLNHHFRLVRNSGLAPEKLFSYHLGAIFVCFPSHNRF